MSNRTDPATLAGLREFDSATVKRHDPRFQWFAGLAVALLLVEALIGDRRRTPSTVLSREVMA